MAGALITGKDIKDDSVTGRDIKDRSVRLTDLEPSTWSRSSPR